MQKTQRKLVEAYHKLQDPKTYDMPFRTDQVEFYTDLQKQVYGYINPSIQKTNQLLGQREHLGRPMSLDMTSLITQPGSLSDALVNQLSSNFVPVRFLAQADDLTDFPNVAAQPASMETHAPLLPPQGHHPPAISYGGGDPSQVGGLGYGSGYAGGGQAQ